MKTLFRKIFKPKSKSQKRKERLIAKQKNLTLRKNTLFHCCYL